MKRMILMALVLVFAFSTYIFSNAFAEEAEVSETQENGYSIACWLCAKYEVENSPNKYHCIHLEDGSSIHAQKDRSIILSAEPASHVKKIYFAWNDSDTMYETLSPLMQLSFPDELETGYIHTLYVRVRYDNDELGERNEFKFSLVDGPDAFGNN